MSANGTTFRNLEIMITKVTSKQPRLSPNHDPVYRSCLIDLGAQTDRRAYWRHTKEQAKYTQISFSRNLSRGTAVICNDKDPMSFLWSFSKLLRQSVV